MGARLILACRCPASSGVATSALSSSAKFWFECSCSACSCRSTADRAHGSPGLDVSELDTGVPCAPGVLAETKVMKDILKHAPVHAAAAGLGYRLIS